MFFVDVVVVLVNLVSSNLNYYNLFENFFFYINGLDLSETKYERRAFNIYNSNFFYLA